MKRSVNSDTHISKQNLWSIRKQVTTRSNNIYICISYSLTFCHYIYWSCGKMIIAVFTVKAIDSSDRSCFKRQGIISPRDFWLLKSTRKPHSSTMRITKSIIHETFNIIVLAKKKSLPIPKCMSSYSNPFSAITTEHTQQNLTQDNASPSVLFSFKAISSFLGIALLKSNLNIHSLKDLLLKINRSGQNLQNIYGLRKLKLPKQKA